MMGDALVILSVLVVVATACVLLVPKGERRRVADRRRRDPALPRIVKHERRQRTRRLSKALRL